MAYRSEQNKTAERARHPRECVHPTEPDPEVRRAYEEHRRRRMEQLQSDPAARRAYERRRAQRARERKMRRIKTTAAAFVSAAAGVAAAFAVHALIF